MTELEQTLSAALTYARVPELPEQLSEKHEAWTKAIVLIKKTNNRTNYAIAHNNGSGDPIVVKDFGPACAIKEVLSIYPFSFTTKQYQPNLRSKDDILEYLVNHGENRADIEALLSKKTRNNRAKSEAKIADDNKTIKALVTKYTIADENALKEARNAAYEAAYPELSDKEETFIEPTE